MALTQEKIEDIKRQLEGLKPEEQQAKIQEIMKTLSPEEREQLMGGSSGGQCPFCLMAESKIQVTKIYEDNDILAILDINPATSGHTLVFTKKHNATLNDLSEDEATKLFSTANKIAKAMTKGINAAGTNIHIASGQAAGQTAPHLLINVIPRFENDGIRFGWNPKKLSEEEMQALSKNISSCLEEEKPHEIEEVIEDDDEIVIG